MIKIKNILITIAIILVFIFVSFVTYNLAEPKAYDFMTKHFLTSKMPFDKYKKIYGSDDIVLVVIDAKTVEKYRWPWKRESYCKIFEYFHYAKPKVIIYDAIITTLDRENPASDQKFFRTVSQFNNLIVGFMPRFVKWENQDYGKKIDENFAKKFGLKVVDKSTKTPDLYKSMMTFPRAYFNVVKNIGSVSILPGFINGNISNWAVDEIYRNHEYIFKYKGSYYPSFALKTYLMLNGNPEIELTNKALKFPEKKYEIKQVKTYYQTITPLQSLSKRIFTQKLFCGRCNGIL